VFREFSSSQLKYFLKIIYFFFHMQILLIKSLFLEIKRLLGLGKGGWGKLKVKSEQLKEVREP